VRRILKYEIEVADYQELEVPRDSEFLTVQVQKGKVCLWVLTNLFISDSDTEKRQIRVITTGQVFEAGHTYLGTIQLERGNFVGHVFVW
jgi:hypothetical protein